MHVRYKKLQKNKNKISEDKYLKLEQKYLMSSCVSYHPNKEIISYEVKS